MRFDKGLHQLLPVVYALPHLEELVLIDSRAILPLECETRPPYRNSVIALDHNTSRPKLQRFTATGGPISRPLLDDLARVLLEPGMHTPLDTPDLSCTSRSNNSKRATWDHTDTLPSHAWAPVLAALSPTLHRCTIGLLVLIRTVASSAQTSDSPGQSRNWCLDLRMPDPVWASRAGNARLPGLISTWASTVQGRSVRVLPATGKELAIIESYVPQTHVYSWLLMYFLSPHSA